MLSSIVRIRISLVLLLVVALVSVYFWVTIPEAIADEIYNASAEGFGGELTLEVTISNGNITEIDIVEHQETPAIAEDAFELLFAAMIESQSAEVDIISGATYTSNAVIEAVRQILNNN